MRKSRPGESHLRAGFALGAGVLTVVGAGVAVGTELRHRRALAADSYRPLLESPIAGEAVVVRSADGTSLHAEVFGDADAPTFLLIPGWTEELQIFDLVVRELLERGYRVVSYDPRGQGASGGERGLDQSIGRYVEDLAAVLETCCPGREDVIIAGHSMGGMSLAAWAGTVDVSSYARGIALISTGVSGLMDDLELLPAAIPQATRRAIMTQVLGGAAPMLTLSTPVSRALNRYMMFGPDATAAQVAFVEQMIWRMHGKLRAGAARTIRDLDETAALAQVNVPALVVVGELDRLTPAVQARRMVEALPQVSEFMLLPRTGHMVTLERPAELADALERLAESVGMKASGPGASVPLGEPR